MKRAVGVLIAGLACACGFDDGIRQYLTTRFWFPFAKHGASFERKGVRRISRTFAGMGDGDGDRPLAKMRTAYWALSNDDVPGFDATRLRGFVAAAKADPTLSAHEREEVELVDSKIDMRIAKDDDVDALHKAAGKLELFLKTARFPEYRSEARGWLAHIFYLLGEQAKAGKIYLDELNRDGSNLSRESLLNSLRLNYGYDGGEQLVEELDQYFDTPEHAAFAIQIVTNPRWEPDEDRYDEDAARKAYARIRDLLDKHKNLLRRESDLPIFTMRTALRMGDPADARKIADAVPPNAAIREEPDFLWMLASANFLSHEFAAAERPLAALFESRRASLEQKAAAAYGLCGVYEKTRNRMEQLRYALWLQKHNGGGYYPVGLSDFSIYWASSGFDLGLLLDAQVSIDELRSFVEKNPDGDEIRLVKYSLAVRLSRENQYDEAARIYESIHALRRAPRLKRLAELYREAATGKWDAKLRLAEFIAANSNGIYFNDAIWNHFQNYALRASDDSRLAGEERTSLMGGERKLRDDQEEYWRAYLIVREIVRESGDVPLSRAAAKLGVQCLRKISERFGRDDEIRKGDIELSGWLRSHAG